MGSAVPGRMEHYKAVSREIRGIFREYTDLIEPLSLDDVEALLEEAEDFFERELENQEELYDEEEDE